MRGEGGKKVSLVPTVANEEIEVMRPLFACSAFHVKRNFGTI